MKSQDVLNLRVLRALLVRTPEIAGDAIDIPEKIAEAERWRVVGERLRALAPDLYERIADILVAAIASDSDDSDDSIPKSYFLT